MATPAEIQKSIDALKKSLSAKSISPALKVKLKAKLQSAEQQLEALKKKRKAGATAASQSPALSRLQELVKKAKYSIYKGSGVDLQKDSKQPALRGGRRVSQGLKANQFGSKKQNKGNVYYENRPNRLDVKQPPKRYPKLEDGGYLAGGGELKEFNLREVKLLSTEKQKYLTDDEGNSYLYENGILYDVQLTEKSPYFKKGTSHRMSKVKINIFSKGGYMAGGGDVATKEEAIKKYLERFPNNASSWDKATDEVRDMAREARVHLEEEDEVKIEPLNFRQLDTPSKWNTEGKKYILSAWSKMSEKAKNSYYQRFSDWIEDGKMAKGGWLIEDEDGKRRIVSTNEKPKRGSLVVDIDGKKRLVSNVISKASHKEYANGGETHRIEGGM